MKEQLIEFKTANLAKEKGFDIEQKNYYEENKELYTDINFPSMQPSKSDIYLNAPTQSLLQQWLREKHSIHISIKRMHCPLSLRVLSFQFRIENEYGAFNEDETHFDTYELALEQGLYEALKLIK